MEEYSKKQIAGSLLLMRRANGYMSNGKWAVCSFQMPDVDMTEVELLELFSTELNNSYTGDPQVASVTLEGEYNPIIFFLIPAKHIGEIGRHECSFNLTNE
ncbi:hypothetical protein GW846_01380 [Candidatus Gracilibacteria bacterium]|nr:hypothetical protein [Candidatus Gracilibacteria bacterium]